MNAMTNDFTAPMSASDVKNARETLGLTQQQLADALGLSSQNSKDTVRSWENGRVGISGPARVALRMMLRDKGLLERTTVKPKKRSLRERISTNA